MTRSRLIPTSAALLSTLCAAVPAAAPASASAACTARVASTKTTYVRGSAFTADFTVCQAGTLRVGIVPLQNADRGNIALRRTVKVDKPGSGVATLTLGALPVGRYRVVLITPAGKHVHAGHTIRIVPRTS